MPHKGPNLHVRLTNLLVLYKEFSIYFYTAAHNISQATICSDFTEMIEQMQKCILFVYAYLINSNTFINTFIYLITAQDTDGISEQDDIFPK